jgi:hypothetical protein
MKAIKSSLLISFFIMGSSCSSHHTKDRYMDPARAQDEIQNEILSTLPKIQECYQGSESFKSGKELENNVKFIISSMGKLSNIHYISKNYTDYDLDHCFEATLLSIQFPRPKDGGTIEVKQPFKFNNKGTK